MDAPDEPADGGGEDGGRSSVVGRLAGEYGLGVLWSRTVSVLLAAIILGVLAFPRQVYAEFIWHYFWGPVYADANGAFCAAWDGGQRTLLYSASACANATEPVAYPGYTVVSEIGYMLILLLSLIGVVLLLRRLDVGTKRHLFYGLLPFMFLGGALRVVEDAADAARAAGVEPAIGYPANTLLISPVIYFTMFGLTLVALVASVWLEHSGRVDSYARPLFAAGSAILLVTVAYLLWLAVDTTYVHFHPQVTIATVVIATIGAAVTWIALERYWPAANEATGPIGAIVIWGHAIDGAANVLILDWSLALGLGVRYTPKHPVNRAVVDLTAAVVPSAITDVIGTVWPFLLLKLVAASVAVWLFNDEIFEESPRYAILLLVAVLAVGLGPGTRDMLRATFGI